LISVKFFSALAASLGDDARGDWATYLKCRFFVDLKTGTYIRTIKNDDQELAGDGAVR